MLEYTIVPIDLAIDREKFIEEINKKVGKGNWYWGFRVKSKLYSWNLGLQLYEDAYWEFLKQNPKLIKELVDYSDVYVYDRYDLKSILDYRKQTQKRDHFQDIAIRRCLVRFGVWFKGMDILKIPGSKFDDHKVEFHLPHLIYKPDTRCSLHSWFSNRLIIVAKTIEDKAKLSELLVQ